jgi:hypothetical protein
MKTHNVTLILALGGLIAFMAGCASTPKATDAKVGAVFQRPIDNVQKAAVDALAVTGFDITKKEANYIEGFRPRKVGLFVGSGGETVGVWLTAQTPDKTEVKVRTARSFVGGAGQKKLGQPDSRRDDQDAREIVKPVPLHSAPDETFYEANCAKRVVVLDSGSGRVMREHPEPVFDVGPDVSAQT